MVVFLTCVMFDRVFDGWWLLTEKMKIQTCYSTEKLSPLRPKMHLKCYRTLSGRQITGPMMLLCTSTMKNDVEKDER